MKKILILNTGGTLTCKSAENGLSPDLKINEILETLKEVVKDFNVSFEDLFALDSSNVQPEEWVLLAEKLYEKHLIYDGIVVIHGTDTMAYTASAVSYFLQGITCPVVFTGSQLSIANPMADAVENCRAAIHMAGSNHSGVFIAFNRKIILGTRASKVRTKSFDAFESINYPYIAQINSSGLEVNHYALPSRKDTCILDTRICTEVFLLKLFPGLNPDIIDYVIEKGYKAIFIQAYGIGGIPFLRRDFISAIERAIQHNILVVVGSQCLYEGSDFSIYETGKKVLDCDVIESKDMTLEAAITKLMCILGRTSDRQVQKEMFHQDFANELIGYKHI